MIFRDPATNKYKVKLYAEKNGQLKGDGLCHYMRVSEKRNFVYGSTVFFIFIMFNRFSMIQEESVTFGGKIPKKNNVVIRIFEN